MAGRIRLISVVIIFCALIVLTRLYFIQIVHGKSFSEDALRQYVNKNTVHYDRGTIYFRSKDNKKVPAAISRSGYVVSINPQIIKDAKAAFAALSKVLVIDEEAFFKSALDKSSKHKEIANRINKETADAVEKLDLYGVSIGVDKWRFYPAGTLASHAVGFVAYKEDNLAGRYGLERYYEEILRKNPSSAYNNFFAEFFSNVKGTLSDKPQMEGDIVMTIEPSVQIFLEKELREIRNKWSSDGAGGIVINPKNGEIIAMAWNPYFDPNNFKEDRLEVFKNPMVESVFEMGSIIKPLTMAAGIDSGAVRATSTYYDAGFLVLNGKRISNYDGRGRGTATMQDVLSQSLNTGVAHVALKMDNDQFAEYMKNFGVDTETGIDLPNETKGLAKNLESRRDIEVATASYGQGIALTPIATVRALSALANGGTLIAPHIVDKIEYANGLSKKISFAPGKQVIKEDTSKQITKMLVSVVDIALRNGTAKIPGYSIAAKTGTAQMTNEGQAGYVYGKYLHSFFGYFPATDPKYLVFLFQIYPKNVQYASETLTEPFLNITKYLINYYQIPPDRPEPET
jgi:cell division protein FtsI/penicillin-binding protein 2